MPSLFERKPEYWERDLADREFEEAVKAELDLLGWSYTDNTTAHERADLYFTRQVRGRAVQAALELKEKRQVYRARWAELARVPEAELLTLDEVAARLRPVPRCHARGSSLRALHHRGPVLPAEGAGAARH